MSSFFSFIGTLFQIAILLFIGIAVIAFFGYNTLRAMSETVKEAWSNIGVTTRKQISMTNQLIETVKGYAESEKFVMLKVSDDLSIANLAQVQQSAGIVVSAATNMAQRFPDLKSNQQYNALMQNISNLENELETQRARYNASAKAYNIHRTSIPHVFYSKMLGFNTAPYLDLHSEHPQDMGMLKTISSDDGERLNHLIGSVGSRALSVGRDLGSRAIEHSKTAVNAAQEKLKQIQVPEYTYLDQDKNPQGPVTLAELQNLQNDGHVHDETSVMGVGERSWKKLKDVRAKQSMVPS